MGARQEDSSTNSNRQSTFTTEIMSLRGFFVAHWPHFKSSYYAGGLVFRACVMKINVRYFVGK